MKLVWAILFVAIYTVSAKPASDEYEYGVIPEDVQNDNSYYDEPVESETQPDPPKVDKLPQIETQPAVFTKNVSESVILPCKILDLDTYVSIWSHETILLYQGEIALGASSKHIRHPDGSLEIKNIEPEDAGHYGCKILGSQQENIEIIHELKVNSPPKIISLLEVNNRTMIRDGENITLFCNSTGYPKPVITWHKNVQKPEILGVSGNVLTIENIKHKQAGSYRCLASNEFGADHAHIEIKVEHKPVVSIEKYIVNSDNNANTEIKCTVNAYPRASVFWQKNGENIVSEPDHISFENRNNHHILTIQSMRESDFGVYTCKAKNSIGSGLQKITLVKTPAVQDFVKPAKGSKEIILTWKVESKSPISEHELQYRKKGEQTWKTVKPEVRNGENDIYTIEQVLKGLESGTYETRLRSQNSHGWSEYSETMPFEGAVNINASTQLSSSLSIIISIALVVLFSGRQ